MKRDVVVIGSCGSNLASLGFALKRLGVDAPVTEDPERVRRATHVILPGVGAAAPGMTRLSAAGLAEVVPSLTQPVLGICLGMQLLFERSEENDAEGLGLLEGRVRKLRAEPRWPHMGWNTLAPRAMPHRLLDGIGDGDWFYFVHGYAAPPGAATLAETHHGDAFAAVVARENVHGVQFHPEKSAAAGRRLLANFFALA